MFFELLVHPVLNSTKFVPLSRWWRILIGLHIYMGCSDLFQHKQIHICVGSQLAPTRITSSILICYIIVYEQMPWPNNYAIKIVNFDQLVFRRN
jgi:hypothetical protein